MDKTTHIRRGRPKAEDAKEIKQRLLENALEIFMRQGFERSTMEEIAQAAAMSKRTLYSRYKDKSDLFLAAMEIAIKQTTIDATKISAMLSEDLEETLYGIAKSRLASISSANGIRLQRLLTNEAFRFPGLIDDFFRVNTGPTIDILSDYLQNKHALDELNIKDPRQTATAFLSLSLGGLSRRILSGQSPKKDEIESSLAFAIQLFINGIKKR